MRSDKLLIAVAVLLAAIYVVFFVHPFGRHVIVVSPSLRPIPGQDYLGVLFALDREYKLTSVKAIALDPSGEPSTNQPIWTLVAASNSTPIRTLFYGQTIPGLKSIVPSDTAAPLVPGKRYRLLLESGNFKGQVDFKTVATP